jgi:hypothetical protein
MNDRDVNKDRANCAHPLTHMTILKHILDWRATQKSEQSHFTPFIADSRRHVENFNADDPNDILSTHHPTPTGLNTNAQSMSRPGLQATNWKEPESSPIVNNLSSKYK